LKKGYLSIGFSDFAEDEDFIAKTKSWADFENAMRNTWAAGSRRRFFLWNFIAEMKTGEWVIVPQGNTFSIYEIESNALLTNDPGLEALVKDPDFKAQNREKIQWDKEKFFILEGKGKRVDIGFVRKVKLIEENIPRDGFSESALRSRMKFRGTNANISDLSESIQNARAFFKDNKPINIKATLYEKSARVWLEAIRTQLHHGQFEKLVAGYFRRIGATRITGKEHGKPGDADVIASFEPLRTTINVQVKHHIGTTDTHAVEQIKSFSKAKGIMADGYVNQYWAITSADEFSDEAEKLALDETEGEDVLLITGQEFAEMLMDAGIQNIE